MQLVPARIDHALTEAAYRGQQLSLATGLGLFMRLVHTVLDPRRPTPERQQFEVLMRRFRTLLDTDLGNVDAGHYPRELLFQLPVVEWLRVLPQLAFDAPLFINRVWRGRYDDLPRTVERDQYPAYYLRNFHFQTDGWLSERSAERYDLQVELLFGGTADVMRRMLIPPIVDAARANPAPRVLDVACGTGRFLQLLHRVLPAASLHGVDLSPFYVAHARDRLHGSRARLSQANAESLPFPDGSFDVVTSVFLFHELPSDARRRVVSELHRVLAPSGTLALLDSEQLSSGSDISFFLDGFPRLYHEPYYRGYLRDDLDGLAREAGFADVTAQSFFVSRRVVAKKPGARTVH